MADETSIGEDILSVIDGASNPDAGDTGGHGDEKPGGSPTPETGDVELGDDAKDGAAGDDKRGGDESRPRKGDGIQKRIDELTRGRHESERQAREERDRRIAAEAEARALKELYGKGAPETPVTVEDDPEPKEEQFKGSFEEYEQARRAWEVRKETRRVMSERDAKVREEAERTKREAEAAEDEKRVDGFIKKAVSVHPTFTETVGAIGETLAKTGLGRVAMELPEGPDLLMYLAKKPDVLDRIASLPSHMRPVELGVLAAEYRRARAAKKITNAEEPFTPVGGRAPVRKSLEDLPMPEFAKVRNAEEAKRR